MSTQQAIGPDEARRVIEAGEARAGEIGQPMNVAVVYTARAFGVSDGEGKQDETVAEAAARAL